MISFATFIMKNRFFNYVTNNKIRRYLFFLDLGIISYGLKNLSYNWNVGINNNQENVYRYNTRIVSWEHSIDAILIISGIFRRSRMLLTLCSHQSNVLIMREEKGSVWKSFALFNSYTLTARCMQKNYKHIGYKCGCGARWLDVHIRILSWV